MDQEKGRPKTIGHRLDRKLEKVRKNYRTVQQDSAKQLTKLQSQTNSKRQLVKKSRANFELLRTSSRKYKKSIRESKKSTRISRNKEEILEKKERHFVQRKLKSRSSLSRD